jgi:ABC-type spermidine/putrescine transport system permease subunit II
MTGKRPGGRFALLPWAMRFWLALILVFIFAPLLTVAVLSFNRSRYGTLPFHFTLQWYAQLQGESELIEATWRNIQLSLAVAVAAAVIGPPLAIFLSRGPRILTAPFRVATLSAVTVPWLLLGVGMLLTLRSIGIGRGLLAMFLGCLAVSLPYVVFMVQARLAALDPAIEQVAQSLGASPGRVLLRVTLPMIRGSVFAGGFMAFITCFNNFIVQYLLAPFGFRTLPLEIYTMVKMGYKPDINALGTILVGSALFLVVVLQLITGSAARLMTPTAEHGQDG